MTAIVSLPKLWVTATLGDVCEIERGVTFPSEAQTSHPSEGSIACLRTSNVQGQVNWKNLIYIPRSYVQNENKLVRQNDILISIANSKELVGKVSFVDEVKVEAAFGGFISVIRATELIDPYYLYSFLRAKGTQEKLRSVSNQTTNIANLTAKEIAQLFVPLPPLPEQRRIADILHQADMLRQWREEANERAKELEKALFYEMFGNPISNPLGWPRKPFEKICDSHLGKMLDKKQQTGKHIRPYLRNINVQWGYIDLFELVSMDFDEEDRRKFRLKKGDILICEGGEVGRAAIWEDQIEECYFQKALHRARPYEGKATSEYVMYLLWALAENNGFQGIASPMTIPHLTGEKLKALEIPVAPFPLQQEFARRIKQFRDTNALQKHSTEKLNDLFLSTSVQAFTGELTGLWREKHKEELQSAAVERDKKLGLRGEVATMRAAVEGRLTPEEEKRFREMTALIAEKMASLQPNIAKNLVTIDTFSEIAKLITSRMINQDTMILNMQKTLLGFSQGMQTALAQMSPAFNTTGSLTDALLRSAEAFRDAFAGSLANIAAEIARREKEQADVELTEKQKRIFDLLQEEEGYFSAKNISQKHNLQQQDVIAVLTLFEALGLVVRVDIPDEANSTPTFPVFETAYRNSRSSDDSRSDDLDALERNIGLAT